MVLLGCTTKPQIDLSKAPLIPKPIFIKPTNSSFAFLESTKIYISQDNESLLKVANYFVDKLARSTGFEYRVEAIEEIPENGVLIGFLEDSSLGNEGYSLVISDQLLQIEGNSAEGVFRGIQTILQLLPDEIAYETLQDGPWVIGTGTIVDYPEYEWRSSMLDVSRHFFGVEDVKRYIDFLAFYKMNILHLHLTDDQGWRIEIKSWPNLTDFGSRTEVGGGEGGYFTQEQYKEIVRYAADRYITIIPEIDMPGHTYAALASYPELNCDTKAPLMATGDDPSRELPSEYEGLYTGIEVGFSTFCTEKEITYKLIDDVIRELAEMTPGPFIHIGGDESHSTKKEDYIPFIERAQFIVERHGKRMIGWDETAQSTLKENSMVQLWHSAEFAKKAIDQGNKLIMSPAHKAYLDMQYDSTSRIGLHWAAYIEVDEAYSWDPATVIEGIQRDDIVGIEAPLWTETVEDMDDIEYLAFPRLPGYAEIGWSKAEDRDWNEYKIRLGQHGNRMRAMGIDYYQSDKVPWFTESANLD